MECVKTYIFKYVAKLHGKGSLRGRVEATTALQAKQRVLQGNELIRDVSVSLLTNQKAARQQSFEKLRI
ncbi:MULTISPECIES: hypothetical protein [unclassified Acinetobacter]|uniref:hypothetical protein n=1 Tax=unclassified Acinetobacter TaxID=196816 RepID=UPI00244720A1|nr:MULTISPECIES: hypothetical protein [unclassified Acinetobacter]MDH0031369.1 hypothetical protein [Acinetobacter sp. GD04021]MDH0887146.1 hypothetical protein [Acinetobacter sp. GD03873]MDH1083565.1 hypothetical protein [Acinetobacter sp. GD03983]MDH2190462.1 hypothetical protein [Acinetobacter sp. GD03645]MDH2204092.1 hypothetical protein [Acinetobacter sp. GD03647]